MTTSSTTNNEKRYHVVVIVLGDIGRSPRMQYHTISLLQQPQYDVTLIGYHGEELVPYLQSYNNNNNIHTTRTNPNNRSTLRIIRFLPPTFRSILERIPILYFVWRILSLSIALLWILVTQISLLKVVDCIIIQNPPAIPLFAVLYIYKKIKLLFQRGIKVAIIIDWHNLGYTMLQPGRFQRIAKRYEYYFAPRIADGHLTVTKAMQQYILSNILTNNNTNNNNTSASSNNVSVVYDCPPDLFRPLDLSEQHAVLSKLHNELSIAIPKHWGLEFETASNVVQQDNNGVNIQYYQTILTEYDILTKQYKPRSNRPAFVTSSTSWTPDEDFGLLLDALVAIDNRIVAEHSTLKIMVVVTGKGPEKQYYLEKISKLQFHAVTIQTIWLQPIDYPKLLACADVGISLHTSTSNLDLPMKVLDLYGCLTPVCAYDFPCLNELVVDTVNGRTFRTSSELSDQLYDLLSPLVLADTTTDEKNGTTNVVVGKQNHNYGKLKDYSQALIGRDRWDTNWTLNALPVLQKAMT